jgi:hypothetical protein
MWRSSHAADQLTGELASTDVSNVRPVAAREMIMESTGRNWILDLVRLATIALVAMAVVQELRKPADQREWWGKVGPVPYDFRPPTLERFRSRLWAPDRPLVSPQPFGLGWTLNFGRLLRGREIG